MNKTLHRTLVIAALVASGTAFAQTGSLTAPNNSAGTPLDMPPVLTRPGTDLTGAPTRTESALTAFDKLDSGHQGYVTRRETESLAGTTGFDEADRNRDGRLDSDEFQRFWNDYQGAGR